MSKRNQIREIKSLSPVISSFISNKTTANPNTWPTTNPTVLDPETPVTILERMGNNNTAIVEWSMPNHEVADADTLITYNGVQYFYVGLQAYHVSGIAGVEFNLNNTGFVNAKYGNTVFDEDNLNEYYALIPVESMRTGLNEVRARVTPKFGTQSIIQGRNFLDEKHSHGITYSAAATNPSFNFNGDYKNTTSFYFWKYGSTYDSIYIDLDNGSDISGNGSQNTPYKSIEGAIYRKWQSTGFAGYTSQNVFPNGAYFYVSGGTSSTHYVGAIAATGANQYPVLGYTGSNNSSETQYIHPPIVFKGQSVNGFKPWFWGVSGSSEVLGLTVSNNLVTRPVLSSWRNFIFGPNGAVNKFSQNNGATLAFIENIHSNWNPNIRSYRNFNNCDFINGAERAARVFANGYTEPLDYRFKCFVSTSDHPFKGIHPGLNGLTAGSRGVTLAGESYRSNQYVVNIGSTFGNNLTTLKLPNTFELTFAPSNDKLYKRDSIYKCIASGPRVNIDAYYIRNYNFKLGFSNRILSKGILTNSTFTDFGNALKTSFNSVDTLKMFNSKFYKNKDHELHGTTYGSIPLASDYIPNDSAYVTSGISFSSYQGVGHKLNIVWNYPPDKTNCINQPATGTRPVLFLNTNGDAYTDEVIHTAFNGPDNVYIYAPDCLNGITGSPYRNDNSRYVRKNQHNLSPSIISEVVVNNNASNFRTKLGRFGMVNDYVGSYNERNTFEEYYGIAQGITFNAFPKDGMTGMGIFSHLAVVNTDFMHGYPQYEIDRQYASVIRTPTTFYIGGDCSIFKNIYLDNVKGNVFTETQSNGYSNGVSHNGENHERPTFFNNVYVKNCIDAQVENGETYVRAVSNSARLESTAFDTRQLNSFIYIRRSPMFNGEQFQNTFPANGAYWERTMLLNRLFTNPSENPNTFTNPYIITPHKQTARTFFPHSQPNQRYNGRRRAHAQNNAYSRFSADLKVNVFCNVEESYDLSDFVNFRTINDNFRIEKTTTPEAGITSGIYTNNPDPNAFASGDILTVLPLANEFFGINSPGLDRSLVQHVNYLPEFNDFNTLTYTWLRDNQPINSVSSFTTQTEDDNTKNSFFERYDFSTLENDNTLVFDDEPGAPEYFLASSTAGFTGPSYQLTEADMNHQIGCKVEYTRFDGLKQILDYVFLPSIS